MKDRDFQVLGWISLFLIIMGLIAGVATIIPLVRADGASSTEEVWVEFKSTWEGQEADLDSSNETAAYTHASKYNASTWDFDVLNITDVRAYVYNGDDDFPGRTYRIGVWNYTADNNAGARFGYIAFTYDDTIGPEWKGATGQGPITVTYNAFFLGVWAEHAGGNVAHIAYSTSGGSEKSIYTSGFAGDPFSEDGSYSDRTYNIQFRGWGYKNTVTTHNLYYGNATYYVARRDLNYTFPLGSSSRLIRFTYPIDEYVVNITRSKGGTFDTILDSGDFTNASYNATHKLVTIPEATIALYGGDYQTYTQSYQYLYTFNGLYYENGTSAGDVNATVYFADGETATVNVNGSTVYGSNVALDVISWEAGQDARPVAFYQVNEEIYLFTPEDTYGVYQFDINDYSGRVAQGECYLESYRTVNGTWRLIERRQFTGIYNDVPLLMVVYEIYRVQIRFFDGSVYDYGYFFPGVDLTPTIAVTEIAFGDQAHTVYQYMTAQATRPEATHISLDYEDLTPGYDTTELNMTITYRNGSVAYTTVVAGTDIVTMNWYGANNITDYVVKLYITHQLHHNVQQTWILDYSRTFQDFPNVSDLGFGSSNFFPIIIALALAATASFKSAILGPFMFMLVISVLSYVGATTYTYTQLAIAWSLTLMLGLALGDRSS